MQGGTGVVHVSKGQASTQYEEHWADKPVYGDPKGDGQEEVVVVLSCHPSGTSPNVVSSEVFIFEMSGGGPKVLAKLPSSSWEGERVSGASSSSAGLLFKHTGIASYLTDILEVDWKTGQRKLPAKIGSIVASPESLKKGGFIEVAAADYQQL